MIVFDRIFTDRFPINQGEKIVEILCPALQADRVRRTHRAMSRYLATNCPGTSAYWSKFRTEKYLVDAKDITLL